MFFEQRFDEVHWQDLYPKSFTEFRKKYLPMIRKGLGGNLYVNFSNYADNTLDRSAFQTPDHSDFVGTYAYPISYVLNFPADIWYGRKAKYLRVLQSRAKNPLHLTSMSASEASWVLRKTGIPKADLDWSKSYYRHPKNSSQTARSFLSLIQMKHEMEPESQGEYSNEKPVYPMRSGVEQTALILKAGYDAIIDDARNQKTATINPREPQQICFLTPSSFRILEVFILREKEGQPKSPLSNFEPDDRVYRKLAAIVLEAIGDRLVSGPVSENFGKIYWSKLGRTVEVRFERPRSYIQGKKLGEKRHKEMKLHDLADIICQIKTEKGIIGGVYEPGTKFSEIARDIASEFYRKETEDREWQPDSIEQHQERQEKAKQASMDAYLDKKRKESEEEAKTYNPKIEEIANRLGIPFKADPSINYMEILKLAFFHLKSTIQEKQREAGTPYLSPEQFDQAVDKFWSDYDAVIAAMNDKSWKTEDFIANNYMLSNREDGKQLRDLFSKIIEDPDVYDRQYNPNAYFVLHKLANKLGVEF